MHTWYNHESLLSLSITAGVLSWSSQKQECRLVSQGRWVKNLSVCFPLFFPLLPPKSVQSLGTVLKQRGSLKLAQ